MAHDSSSGSGCSVRRLLWCVDSQDIDLTSWDCDTVAGTLQLPNIRSTAARDPTIFTRHHSCFCDAYVHDYLAEGDDFAVIAEEGNAEAVDYYILRCTKAKYVLQESTVDDYGEAYDAHSMVVLGHYFQQVHGCGHYIHFVQYEWPKVAIHYSHLVLVVELRLERIVSKKKGSTPRWRLGPHEHKSIM
ncbi:hypothetical protein GOP47_0029806 [Adiantum capillus-veneris]|nr:hypothetical protein GOP47_0029806 [Adiantum capillus-veneris]